MASALKLRADYSAAALRRHATRSKEIDQSRRLLSLAAVMDGMDRTDAARIGGIDRQTLHDWVLRFNQRGPDGLLDRHVGKLLKRLDSSHICARPRHPGQGVETMEALKSISRTC
jgi:Winged helix-turn helix